MPERLENLMQMSTEGLQVPWDAPETIRRRAQRRKLRRRVAAGVIALAALGWGGTAVLGSTAAPKIPQPEPSASGCVADLTLPDSESEVKLRVYHADPGVATVAAEDFRMRKFEVVEVAAANEPVGDLVAVIRFGPAEVGDARLVQAYLPDDPISMDFDPAKTGTVDVFLGSRYNQLNTALQMRQRIAVLGRPEAPC